MRYPYIHFESISEKPDIWSCRNNKSGEELGQVLWYRSWRQYCFVPTTQAIYSMGCLNDIADFIGKIKPHAG